MAFTQNAINNLLAYTSLSTVPANSILGNNTGSATNAIALTPSQVLDLLGSTRGDILYRGASGWAVLAPGTSGQVLESGGTGADPFWGAVSGSYSPLPQTVVSATSQAAAANNGYITNNAALCTVTLPSTISVGQLVQVTGQGTGGWKIAQNAGQSIIFNSNTTTAGTGGSLASTLATDNITLMCTVANTTFNVVASQGNISGI